MNYSNLPMSLVISVSTISPFSVDSTNSANRGIGYISIFSLVCTILIWTVGFQYLGYEHSRQDLSPGSSISEELESGSELRSLAKTEATAKLETAKPKKFSKAWFIGVVKSDTFKRIVSPVNVTMIVALIIGLIPPVQQAFLTGYFRSIYDICDSLGVAAVPIQMLVLGGTLSSGPQPGALGAGLMAAQIVLKLIFLPAIALAVIIGLRYLSIVPDDPMFTLVVVIEAAVPSATNLVMMAQKQKVGIAYMASIQFWQYILSLGTLSLYIAITIMLTTDSSASSTASLSSVSSSM